MGTCHAMPCNILNISVHPRNLREELAIAGAIIQTLKG
uniref:Uncharacterized protein n=1 Tax=Arundo donax TaxID=35708 RepID=A0A0A9EII4_ARUDO